MVSKSGSFNSHPHLPAPKPHSDCEKITTTSLCIGVIASAILMIMDGTTHNGILPRWIVSREQFKPNTITPPNIPIIPAQIVPKSIQEQRVALKDEIETLIDDPIQKEIEDLNKKFNALDMGIEYSSQEILKATNYHDPSLSATIESHKQDKLEKNKERRQKEIAQAKKHTTERAPKHCQQKLAEKGYSKKVQEVCHKATPKERIAAIDWLKEREVQPQQGPNGK